MKKSAKFALLGFVACLLATKAFADDLTTVCQGQNVTQMGANYWGNIRYYLQANPANDRVDVYVNFSQQSPALPQCVTFQLPDGRTFQCAIQTPVSGKLMMAYDWLEHAPFQTKFRVEAFNRGAWRDWTCLSQPIAKSSDQVTLNYDCGGVAVSFQEHPDSIQVMQPPIHVPRPHPGAPQAGPPNACSAHGGLAGQGFDSGCAVLVEVCHDYDKCKDTSKQYTSGPRVCGICVGFSL